MHAGSGNHGCEAIVDSLVRMMPVDHFRLMTNSAAEDQRYLPAEVRARVDIIEEQHIDQHIAAHAFYYAKRKVTGNGESFLRYRYKPLTGSGAPGIAVSIGGDNYCYPSMVHDLMMANAMFHHQGTPTVLLGCSIEPALVGEENSFFAGEAGTAFAGETGGASGRTAGGAGVSDSGAAGTGAAGPGTARPGIAGAGTAGSGVGGTGAARSGVAGKEVQALLEDLYRYDRIIARESITYETVREALNRVYGNSGLDKVVYCPDPAFTLPADESGLPEGFESGNTVGLNLSPMVQDYAASGESVLVAYEALIQHILDTTGMKIALIPHVVWDRSNDLVPLRRLYDAFRETGRVQLVGDMSAEKLKGVIANCRFFIGARTHATIAAYSTLIPTLVVGYSVKARGIARDLFGTAEHYVLPVQTLKKPEQLIDAWKWLYSHEDDLHYQLAESAPGLRTEAARNGDLVHEVMRKG